MIPKISCLLRTTVGRRWVLPLAISWWQRQTYPHRELVIICDDGDVSDLLPYDSRRIRYVPIPKQPALAAKTNEALRHARYSWVNFWDDDDWRDPAFLEAAACLISQGADFVGSPAMLVHQLEGQSWSYRYPIETAANALVVGGTLCFPKDLVGPLPGPRGNGELLCVQLLRQGLQPRWWPEPERYVAFVHGSNTGNHGPPEGARWWSPIPRSKIVGVVGDDLADMEAAYTARHASSPT